MTFFYVLYGDKDEKKIFNANCTNKVLLSKIKEECGYMECDIVDLADTSGNCYMLHQQPDERTMETIDTREECILCQVIKEGDTVKLKALYKKPGAETEMEIKVGKGGKKPRKGKRPSSRK